MLCSDETVLFAIAGLDINLFRSHTCPCLCELVVAITLMITLKPRHTGAVCDRGHQGHDRGRGGYAGRHWVPHAGSRLAGLRLIKRMIRVTN